MIEAGHAFGWIAAHFRPARTDKGWRTPVTADGKGFFDLVLMHPEWKRMILAELKGMRGKLTDEQEMWKRAAEAVAEANLTVEYHLWTPRDWPNRILDVLGPSGGESTIPIG